MLMSMRFIQLSKPCPTRCCIILHFSPVSFLLALFCLHLSASHHVLVSITSRAFWANPVIVCHTSMSRTPVEMLFAKTSLAGFLRAFRTITLGSYNFRNRGHQLTIVCFLHSCLRFDLKPSAAPLFLLPSSLSSLFLETAAPYCEAFSNVVFLYS